MLLDIAEFHGRSAAGWIRHHIREEHAATKKPRMLRAMAEAQPEPDGSGFLSLMNAKKKKRPKR